jgi:RNA polymerase sigma-70 factor (ECF subfamily)
MVAERLAHRVHELLPELPDQQRQVVILRDVEGLAPGDVTSMLGVTDGHQRVLLHRGRAKLRALLSVEMGGDR